MHHNIRAWLKAIVLLPGNVLGVVPAVALLSTDYGWSGLHPFWMAIGLLLLFPGLALAGWCMRLFAVKGEGTPAPWAPPQKLIVAGPYQYVRNPMICSVLMLLLAEASLLRSGIVLWWFLLFLLGNMVYFPLVEERKLEKKFGESYTQYKRHVPRWIPRLRAWRCGDV
jgi:protein-S-isoprenylcysteine O-methyltransferase Ste14